MPKTEPTINKNVWRSIWPVGLILLLHVALLSYSAMVHSPTLNEPAHLAAGISHWEKQRFELYRVNPPLVRMVAALPVMAGEYETDWDGFYEHPGARPVFAIGENLAKANSERMSALFTKARWACIPFSLIGALVCFFWARDLFGPRSGWVALLLWCFSPNILGHASLITPDAPATALGLAACYTFWLWLRKPGWIMTCVNGLVLGVAELSKSTLIIFYPLWPLLWLLYRLPDRKSMSFRDWMHELVMLAARMVICIYVINSGYGFEGSFTKLGDFQFVSTALKGVDTDQVGNRFSDSWVSSVPVPFPKNYVLGIDIQRNDFETFPRPSYLRGTLQEHGWWYYYIYAMLIKIPLGTWALVAFVLLYRVAGIRFTSNIRDEIFLLLPPLTILGFVSSQTGFNEHLRYVLPVFPFLFVWASQLAGSPIPEAKSPRRHGANRWRIIGCLGLLAWSVTSSLLIYPHSLSYFNESVGGPDHGHAHLIHSNIDWGQDHLFLKQWTDQNPDANPLYLATCTTIDPALMGIEYRPAAPDDPEPNIDGPVEKLKPGYYAVSVNLLRGYPYSIYDGQGGTMPVDTRYLSQLNQLRPHKKIGYSIYVFHVGLPGAQ